MQPGRVVFIAFVVSALTSAGMFFGLRAIVARGGSSGAPTVPASTTSAVGAASSGGASGAVSSHTGGAKSGPRSSPASRALSVPPVRRKKLSEALRALIDVGLKVGAINRQDHKTLAKDLVIRAVPPAGTPLLGGAKVDLYVSNGQREQQQVTVPSVRGLREAGARSKLRAAGFDVRVRYRYDEDKMEGVILGQSPKRDAKLAPGSVVTIMVNREQ